MAGSAAGATLVTVGAGTIVARRRVRALRAIPDPTPMSRLVRPDGVERTVVTADGAQLATITCGDGPQTLVLAHGWTADLRTWDLVRGPLADNGWRLVMFDQRGHGESTVGSLGFDLDLLGADLAAVLEQLDLHDVTVLGHSMGGIGAQLLAIAHPEVCATRVRGLVLLSTLANNRSLPGATMVARMLQSAAYERYRTLETSISIALTTRVFGDRVTPSMIQRSREMFLDCPTSTVLGAGSAISDFDLRDRLRSVDLPALVICGDRDRLTPPAASRELAAALPASRLELLEGCGHIVPFERPDDLVSLVCELATAA